VLSVAIVPLVPSVAIVPVVPSVASVAGDDVSSSGADVDIRPSKTSAQAPLTHAASTGKVTFSESVTMQSTMLALNMSQEMSWSWSSMLSRQ
jgi:hypothetical protein